MPRSWEPTQLDTLIYWFQQYDTINLAQAKAGLPSPDEYRAKVRIERVAPLIKQLRDAGWVIVTEYDAAKTAHYRVVSKPETLAPGQLRRVDPKREPTPDETKGDPKWECTKPGCLSGVRPDVVSVFDGRYTTGKCFTHGKVVLVRR
jgi:hypothetical protein